MIFFADLTKSLEEFKSSVSSFSSSYLLIAFSIKLIATLQSLINPCDSSHSKLFFSENGQNSFDLTKSPNALYICDIAAAPNLS